MTLLIIVIQIQEKKKRLIYNQKENYYTQLNEYIVPKKKNIIYLIIHMFFITFA